MTKTASHSSVSSQGGVTTPIDERPLSALSDVTGMGPPSGSPGLPQQAAVRRDSQGMAKRRYSLQPQRSTLH